MGIFKQSDPIFKSKQEVEEFIKQRELAVQFWGSIKSIDMSELIAGLKEIIENAKVVLMEMEKCEGNLKVINGA